MYRHKEPMVHVFLRLALCLTPSSAVIEQLWSLVTVVCPVTKRSMCRETLENRIIVARDAPHWQQYDVGPLMRRRSTRSSVREKARKDAGKKHNFPDSRLRQGMGSRGAKSKTHVDFDVTGERDKPAKRARTGPQEEGAAAAGAAAGGARP
eukprot:gene16813-biopygen5067